MNAPHPLRGLPREVVVLAAVACAVAVGFGVVAPALPVFARHFGVGRGAAGAVISVFAGMRLVSALGSGRLVDRLGERRVLAAGIGIVAVSSALTGLAQSYVQLLVLRGAGGIGSAMFTVSAMSLLLRSVPSAQRGRATGAFWGGFLVGSITGPAVGGVLTEVSIRAPFFLYAGTLTVAGSIGLLALPRTSLGSRHHEETAQTTSLRTALAYRAYRAALAANFADAWAVIGVRSALIPLFVVESLHRPARWTGIGLVEVAAVNGLVLLVAGGWADRGGRRPVLVGGCAGTAAGMLVLAGVPTLPGFLAAMALLGVGSGLLDVAPSAIVGDVVSGRGGTVVAAFQMTADAGSMIGPFLTGRLADRFSYGPAFAVTAAVALAAAALAVAAPETRARPEVATRVDA